MNMINMDNINLPIFTVDNSGEVMRMNSSMRQVRATRPSFHPRIRLDR